MYIYIYMVFTTEEFLEVAIESWPDWDGKFGYTGISINISFQVSAQDEGGNSIGSVVGFLCDL